MQESSASNKCAATDLWETPPALFAALDREFHFTLDAAALPENAKCAHFLSPDRDALREDCPWSTANGTWRESVWLNPPYGRGIERWMEKAYRTSCSGVRVVCLIPARTNAPWWHDFVMKAREIRFVRRKVSFGGPVRGVPFWGSVVVVFGPGVTRGAPEVSSWEQPKR